MLMIYRTFLLLVLSSVVHSAGAQVRTNPIKARFRSKNYTVRWAATPSHPAKAQLVIGYGSGHGGNLGWVRFRPVHGGVEILSIELDEGWRPYKSKWSPDEAPVVVKRGYLSARLYAALLRNLGLVEAARLTSVTERNSMQWTFYDFWTSVRLSSGSRKLLDWDWAGYWNSRDEATFAKPDIAVDIAREALARIALKVDSLSADEREWASAKFRDDWQKYRNREYYWWVAERLVIMSGAVGDRTVIPTLLAIVSNPVRGEPSDRRIYYAINAITRLTGRDVRPKPVEEMDLEATRQKVLEAFSNLK